MNVIKAQGFLVTTTIFLLLAIPITTYVVIRSEQDAREPQAAILCESNCTAEETLPAADAKEDLNSDGTIDSADLSIVLSAFGKEGENAADLNKDKVVNESDVALVKAKWSK